MNGQLIKKYMPLLVSSLLLSLVIGLLIGSVLNSFGWFGFILSCVLAWTLGGFIGKKTKEIIKKAEGIN